MARSKPKFPTLQELQHHISGELRRTALRPSIAGYKPMDHQKDFHSSMAKGRAFIGGNRSGKTVGGAAELVMWMTGKHPFRPTPPPPVRCRAVAVDFDHGVELIVKPEIIRWMPPSELIDGSWEKSYSRELKMLTLANGSTLEFMSYDQDVDKFAGTSRHAIWFDEEPPKAIFDENMARLIDTGGSWWLTMTPVEGMTWVYDNVYIASQVDPHIDVFIVSMDQNIYINTSEIDAYLSGMTEDEKKARRHGQFIQLGGLIYGKVFDSKRNIIPSFYGTERWETVRTKWRHILAMDHGFNNPTAWLFIAIDSHGRMVVYDEYYKNREIIRYHATQVKERIRELRIEPAYNVGDPSIRNTDPITGTSVQLEYQEHGLTILPGNNDVKAGINMVARMLEDGDLMITDNCEKLIWEIQRYRWARWQSKKTEQDKNAKDEPVKKDDHACDALRYAIASRPQFEAILHQSAGNFVHAPTAIDPTKPYIDLELLRLPERYEYSDYHLGSEW